MKKKINAKNFQKMKNRIIIPIHSLVDVITNSSSELFIIDKSKGLDAVQEVVNQALAMFPPKYGENAPNVFIDNPEFYEDCAFYNINEAVDFLKRRGFKVEEPAVIQDPEVIIISWEMGYMQKGFIDFISNTFNVEITRN
jgi:hypothetical protein